MTLLFIWIGVCGIILSFQNITYISYNSFFIFAVDAVVCLGLGVILHFFRKKIALISLEMLGALVILFFVFYFMTDMGKVLQYFAFNSFAAVSSNNTDVTALALYISLLLIWVLFLLEIVAHNHIIPFLVLLTWTLCSPLFGIEIGTISIMFMVLFQTAFFVLNMTNSGSVKRYFSAPVHAAFSRQSLIVITAVFITALVVAAPFVNNNTDPLYTSVDNTEGYVYQIMNGLTGMSSGSISNGKINTGNLYRTGNPELEIQLENAPTETLYLYKFKGGDYNDGEWKNNYDNNITSYIAYQQNISSDIINNYYLVKQLLANPLSSTKTELPNTAFVEFLNKSFLSDFNFTDLKTYYSNEPTWIDNRSTFMFYPRNSFKLDFTNAEYSEYRWVISSFKQAQKAYMQNIQSFYTRYPEQTLPRLKKLCSETPLSDLDEVTSFIVYTLSTNAVYTTTPGTANRNQDIIEYFLFENHKGYCVHYASTAALMYRMYGIPARYVSGYSVPSYEFAPQSDGTYTATVSDKQAHAWVEIYLENYGWVPVDFTPSDIGIISATYPGFTYSDMMNIFNQHGWKLPINEQNENSSVSDNMEDTNNSDNIQTGLVIILLCGAAIALITVFLIQRRKAQLKTLRTCNIRRTFDMMMSVLHFAGLMKDYNGTETDFIPKLCETLPYLSGEEVEQLVQILEKRAYGNNGVSKEEVHFVKSVYQKVSKQTYMRLGKLKRLIFRYIKGFI
ncbi:MAG: transglutaminase family protein [Acutalibacteraceae bacterium]